MERFDGSALETKLKPYTDKLIARLEAKKIKVTEDELNNFVFNDGKKEIKISRHNMFRYSGISVYCKDKGENFSETVEVTDQMYVENIIEPIIEILLNPPIKKK